MQVIFPNKEKMGKFLLLLFLFFFIPPVIKIPGVKNKKGKVKN